MAHNNQNLVLDNSETAQFLVDISGLWSRTKASTACSGHHPLDAFTDDSNWVLCDLSETKKHPMISSRE